MTNEKQIARIESLTWVLIYGGLFLVILGLATLSSSTLAGWLLLIVGAIAAASGAALIWIRSRMQA